MDTCTHTCIYTQTHIYTYAYIYINRRLWVIKECKARGLIRGLCLPDSGLGSWV